MIAHDAGTVPAGSAGIAVKLWAVIANASWVGVHDGSSVTPTVWPAMLGELSMRWMSSIGKYSYAVDIFHLPVHLVLISYAGAWLTRWNGVARFAIVLTYVSCVFGVSVLLALASCTVIEQPLLSLKRNWPMPVGSAAHASNAVAR